MKRKKRSSTTGTKPLLVDRPSAALKLSISVRHLDELLALGVIRSVKLGKWRLVPQEQLLRLASARK
jgi:hypothetical protein